MHTYRDDIGLSPVAELVVLKNIRLIIWLDDEDDEKQMRKAIINNKYL